MKVTINEKHNEREIEFPCLMECKESMEIVLFTSYKCGVVIKNVSSKLYGYYTDWHMAAFKPFKGSITLEND